MERHNSCVNTRAIIEYMERRGFPPQALLEGLDDHLRTITEPLNFLRDQHNWVSAEVCAKMFANAGKLTGDPQVAFNIGYESVTTRNLGYIQAILLRALATPRSAVTRIKNLNYKFNRTKDLDLVQKGKDRAQVRLYWYRELPLNKDFCSFNKGIYSAVPTIWGLTPAQVEETRCQFQGDQCCEFQVRWKNPSLWQRLALIFSSQRGLLSDTIQEMERDKMLLRRKYQEVQALNLSLQQRIDQLISIQQASGAILSELDYQRLFPTVLELFIRAIGYSRGMIMLVDHESGVLRYVQGVGKKGDQLDPLRNYQVPLDRRHNLLVQVANSGQPLISENASLLNLNPENIIIQQFKPESIVVLPLTSQGRVMGILAADRGADDPAAPHPDREYLQVFANQVALAIENAGMYRDLRESFLSTVRSLAMALEAMDPYTRGHSDRVTQYAVRLAQRLSFKPSQVEQIQRVCSLHDIGKIGVGGPILNKVDPLTDQEMKVIRQHPVLGHAIIEPLKLTTEEVAIVRHHHERFDGDGYPDGLNGDEIPTIVRVVTVCDAFDAMTSHRPYRGALDLTQALGELEDNAGDQFDPTMVATFVSMVREGLFRDLLLRERVRPDQRLELA